MASTASESHDESAARDERDASEPARVEPLSESTHASAATPFEAEPIEPAPVARVEPYALPIDSLAAVAESAGLQWVRSDTAKIEAAQAAMAAMPAPPRVAREIVVPPPADEGPLVMVETRKELAQVKLPFETTAQETQGV
jgi:ribonuclease E